MTALRKRMFKDLQLRGYSKRTIEMYIRAVRQLTQYYNKSPDQITDEQLREYLLDIKNNKKWSPSATTIALSGIKFFYIHTLQKQMPIFNLAMAKREDKLPVILTGDEVRLIFKKGKKDRYVLLPQPTLALLRNFYITHRNPKLIFPAPGKAKNKMAYNQQSLPISSIQGAFKEAVRVSSINKQVSVRHLRHAYAVHLLEAGVDIRRIQEYLGHHDIRTTMIYTKLTHQTLLDPMPIINQIMSDL